MTDEPKWEIWSEGYSATGDRSGATFHGTAHGSTFRDAVISFVAQGRLSESEKYFDAKRMTYWGCRFFDNEADARRSFG